MVTWSAPPGQVNTSDWIGMFRVGADNHASLTYVYTGGQANGSVDFAAPMEITTLEFRYLPLNGYIHVATSNPVTVFCGDSAPPTGPDVLVFTGGHLGSDCAVITALESAGFRVTGGVQWPQWDGTQTNLDNFAAVVVLNNGNWTQGWPAGGIQALADFMANGGGVVTGEWFLWKAWTDGIEEAKVLSPIQSYCGFNYAASTTYTLATPDPILSAGLPPSFTFSLGSFNGSESCLVARPEATVFFTSSNGGGAPGAAGVVGWDVFPGRLLSFSTLLSQTELEDANYRRLLTNAVAWAAEGCGVLAPPLGGLSSFTDCMTGPAFPTDPSCASGDLNCNGRVDLRDVALLQRNFRAP